MSSSNRLEGPSWTPAPRAGAGRPPGWRDRLGSRRWLVDGALVTSLVMELALVAMWLTDSGWWAAQPEGADAAGVAATVAAPSGAEPGVLVRSRLTAGGDLVVTQWLTFDDAVRELPVSVEPASIGASDDVATEVRDVTITADDRVVSAQVANLVAGDSTVLDLGPPAREIRLDYVVAGAVEPSQVSAPGRAVVDLNPVHVAVPGAGSLVIEVTAAADGAVLSMACGTSGELPTPCGRDAGRGWHVHLPSADGQDVIASVDMPRA